MILQATAIFTARMYAANSYPRGLNLKSNWIMTVDE